MPPKNRGSALQKIRLLKGLSLTKTAKDARISPAYLQKLERNGVEEPSPHILLRIAKALGVEYLDLMRLFGYIRDDESRANAGASLLAQALSGLQLSEDEVEAVARYLAWYRHNKGESV
jgi:transcriptional regulator with XRE-family HTH domain